MNLYKIISYMGANEEECSSLVVANSSEEAMSIFSKDVCGCGFLGCELEMKIVSANKVNMDLARVIMTARTDSVDME